MTANVSWIRLPQYARLEPDPGGWRSPCSDHDEALQIMGVSRLQSRR